MKHWPVVLLLLAPLQAADHEPARPADMVRIVGSAPPAAKPDLMSFTLSGVDGDRLRLATLQGKVLVLDFWATWCEPCREQHLLLEKVKQRFRNRDDVMFLSISTDEQKLAVKPFLAREEWHDKVYFESGLSQTLRVTSLPASLVIDRSGHIANRVDGFARNVFVETLNRWILAAADSLSVPD
jgi:thiol-disulfide isomerase/thioredoxin